jgi:hypothetical protein
VAKVFNCIDPSGLWEDFDAIWIIRARLCACLVDFRNCRRWNAQELVNYTHRYRERRSRHSELFFRCGHSSPETSITEVATVAARRLGFGLSEIGAVMEVGPGFVDDESSTKGDAR